MAELKEFDRSICFMFFEDYRKTAKEIEEDFGKEAVADYYNAIIDYALYENEPELKGAVKYVWHTTKTTIDKSIERRSNGFRREDTEKTNRILEYKKENPEATQREIAEATGTSPGKVNKVLKSSSDSNTDSSSFTDSYSNTYTTREREREHDMKTKKEDNSSSKKPVKKKRLCDLSDWDLEGIIDKLNSGTKYADLYKSYNLEDNCLHKGVIAEIQAIIEERGEFEKSYYSGMKFGQDAPVKKKDYDDFTPEERSEIYADALYENKEEVAKKYHTTFDVVKKIYNENCPAEFPFN